MGQFRLRESLRSSKVNPGVRRFVLTGVVLTLVLVWLAPRMPVALPGELPQRDSIAVVFCMTRIPEALARVREEQSRTDAEQQAFEAFATHIHTMDTDTSTQTPATPGQGRVLTTDSTPPTGTKMARVRRAYRDTVLSTTHYCEDYDEPLAANVSEEFGPELATALTQDGILTPPLQQALLEASQTAASERTAYQKTLDAEADALQDAKRHLRTLTDTLTHVRDQTKTPQSFTALIDAHARVENLKADCATIIEDRQATLADRSHRLHHRLHDYLYRNQDWTFPVLADTLDCRAQIQAVEHELVQTISRHP